MHRVPDRPVARRSRATTVQRIGLCSNTWAVTNTRHLRVTGPLVWQLLPAGWPWIILYEDINPQPLRSKLRVAVNSYPKTVGDCPEFAESSQQIESVARPRRFSNKQQVLSNQYSVPNLSVKWIPEQLAPPASLNVERYEFKSSKLLYGCVSYCCLCRRCDRFTCQRTR